MDQCTAGTAEVAQVCISGVAGNTCQYATHASHCNNLGTVQTDGTCVCQAGVGGLYCQCVSPDATSGACLQCASVAATYTGSQCETPSTTECNGHSLAGATMSPRSGAAYCIPCADSDAAGPYCEYTRAKTCNSQGTPLYDGKCTDCAPGFAGPNCEYSDGGTCNRHGAVSGDGKCVCEHEFVQGSSRQCTVCKPRITGASCNQCQSAYYAPSYPACEPKCTAHATGQSGAGSVCLCHAGWRGERCECFAGLGVSSSSSPCLMCATAGTARVTPVNGRCAHPSFISTTTTRTATTTTTTTASVTCLGKACIKVEGKTGSQGITPTLVMAVQLCRTLACEIRPRACFILLLRCLDAYEW